MSNVSAVYGFGTKWPTPAPIARLTFSFVEKPLDPMMRTAGSIALSAMIIEGPSITGIAMSVSTAAMSARCFVYSATASAPFAASMTR